MRYFLAGLKPFAQPLFWLPLGIFSLALIGFSIYQQNPEWLGSVLDTPGMSLEEREIQTKQITDAPLPSPATMPATPANNNTAPPNEPASPQPFNPLNTHPNNNQKPSLFAPLMPHRRLVKLCNRFKCNRLVATIAIILYKGKSKIAHGLLT